MTWSSTNGRGGSERGEGSSRLWHAMWSVVLASGLVWPVASAVLLAGVLAVGAVTLDTLASSHAPASTHIYESSTPTMMAAIAYDEPKSAQDGESHWVWLAGGVGLLVGLGTLVGWVGSIGRWRGQADLRLDRIEKDDAARAQSIKEMREAIAEMLREERASREAMLREEREARVRGEERVAEELKGIRGSLDRFIEISMKERRD